MEPDFDWPNGLEIPIFLVESLFKTGQGMGRTTIRFQGIGFTA